MLDVPDRTSIIVKELQERDADFMYRVFNEPLTTYVNRLRHAGFAHLDSVLDIGCGFGQWSFGMGRICDLTVGLDVSESRVSVARDVAHRNDVDNVSFLQADLNKLPIATESVDGVFSYSAVYFAAFPAVANEIYRVLKPGGRVYICTNGIGKYLHDVIYNPNPSVDFSPRHFAVRTIWNTLNGRTDGLSMDAGAHFMRPQRARDTLEQTGFANIQVGSEGTLSVTTDNDTPRKFYNGEFFNLPRVFEMIAYKPT